MGWQIAFDWNWGRDIGYGVPAECDYPGCQAKIDRGLSWVCGSEAYGGEHGCGLFFCDEHLRYGRAYGNECARMCTRCYHYRPPFAAKPDVKEWLDWKETDESWAEWRAKRDLELAHAPERHRKTVEDRFVPARQFG